MGTLQKNFVIARFYFQNLKKLLDQSLEGKAILQTYEMNKYLEEEDRIAFVDIVLNVI